VVKGNFTSALASKKGVNKGEVKGRRSKGTGGERWGGLTRATPLDGGIIREGKSKGNNSLVTKKREASLSSTETEELKDAAFAADSLGGIWWNRFPFGKRKKKSTNGVHNGRGIPLQGSRGGEGGEGQKNGGKGREGVAKQE